MELLDDVQLVWSGHLWIVPGSFDEQQGNTFNNTVYLFCWSDEENWMIREKCQNKLYPDNSIPVIKGKH